MTPHEEQIEAMVAMCFVYLEQCSSAEEVNALGFELADLKGELRVPSQKLEAFKRAYLKRMKEFK